MENFIVEYLSASPRFVENLKAFEKKWGVNLLSKLSNERNEVNLHSWRSEVEFGFLFGSFCDDLKFELRIDQKRPDWTVWSSDQKIIVEVLRINTVEEELLRNMENEKTINAFLRQNPKAQLITGGQTKIMSSEYFYGHQAKLIKKEEKYREIVERYCLPFIICIESTVDTYINERDTYDFLIQYNDKGFFYQNKEFGNTVTGVLLRTYFGQYFYFPNKLSMNNLNKENFAFLDKYTYKGP